jgi:sugar phosphate permease
MGHAVTAMMKSSVRYVVLALLLTGTAINYLDRVNIAVAAPSMMAATGLLKGQFGLVFSTFLVGYACMQIPAGLIADRSSVKHVLTIAFFALSILTALTPLASDSIASLLLIRCLLGMSEAVMFPAVTAVNMRWFPPSEFARAQMISASGAPIGQMVAYPLTAWLVVQNRWPTAFYASAGLGIAWLSAWCYFSANAPRQDPGISIEKLAKIDDVVPRSGGPVVPLRRLLTSGPIFMLSASAMCFGFVLWTFLFWLPTYLVEERGLSLARVGVDGMGIQACGVVALVGSGIASDFAFRRARSAARSRTKLPGACLVAAMLFLLAAVTVRSPTLCVALLTGFYFFLMSSPVAYYAAPSAILPRQAASVYGIINCSASFGGVFGPAIVGHLNVGVGNWAQSFGLVTAVGLVGAILLIAAPVRRLDAAQSTALLSCGEGGQ